MTTWDSDALWMDDAWTWSGAAPTTHVTWFGPWPF